MRISNAPARKLHRQLTAQFGPYYAMTSEIAARINAARVVRTKKRRA